MMKRSVLLGAVLSLCPLILAAQGIGATQPAPKSEAALRMLRENPNRAGVNTHIYEFREEKNTPPPSGFKYVYLAHYARHGARNDWRPQHYTYVIDILEKADSAGILNGEGRYLLEKTRGVLEEHGGMDGHLTRRGEFEHREIARRLYSRYKPVFRHGSKYVRVESTTVPRTLVSMACCVSELSKLQKDLDFTIDTGEKYMEILNNGASAEHKKASMVLLDSLRLNTPSDNETIFPCLLPSMPIAGEDGTLSGRMRKTKAQGNVKAKTGTVMGVSALAGYCTAANGHYLCFSIINMGNRQQQTGRSFQDRVCEVLCSQ